MTDRQQELVRAFQEHLDAEQEQDVERTLRTLAHDIVYEHPFRPHEQRIAGIEAVREYYQRSWSAHPFRAIRINRSWLSADDTLLAETEAEVGPPDKPECIRGLAVAIFRDGLLVREIVYNGPYLPISARTP